MALYRTGGVIFKSIKPVLVNPCFIVPSTVYLQVRHAARKGYREKVRKEKLLKQMDTLKPEVIKLKKKFPTLKKTENLKKPEPPDDDIIILDMFNYKKFSLPEAVKLHREYHHPEIFNNPSAPIALKIEINMTGKKSTQVIKPFSGIISIPHPFVIKHARSILVLCEPEDVKLALDSGASVAGGVDVVKKIQEGVIQPTLYDFIIAHTSFLPNLTPIRPLLKDQLPKAKLGTLTNDLKNTIYRFLHGISYSCVPMESESKVGIIDCYVGRLDMELEHLEANFKALVEGIESHRPPREGDFISWVWCSSKPSREEFLIDLSKYIDFHKRKDLDDDEEFEEDTERRQERLAKRKLQQEYEEMTLK